MARHRIEGIAMTPKLLSHLKTDVPDTNSNVLGIADSEIDTADIRTIRNQDAKMIRLEQNRATDHRG
jgi:hypothetical protein